MATDARRRQGELTRLRILQAADAEFGEHGYHGATMALIAARAGVAVQTVYFNFQNKAVLLRKLIEHSVMGFTDPQLPEDTDWFNAVLKGGDPATALGALASGSVGIFQRVSAVMETARLAGIVDPEAARIYADSEGIRMKQFAQLAEALARHGALRPGITATQARDTLLMIASSQTYLQATRDHGWTNEQWGEWLGDALCRLLLP